MFTTEHDSVQRSLIEAGVKLVFSQNVESYDGKTAGLSCMYTERESAMEADAVVMVTARLPNDDLYYELQTALGATLTSLEADGFFDALIESWFGDHAATP